MLSIKKSDKKLRGEGCVDDWEKVIVQQHTNFYESHTCGMMIAFGTAGAGVATL